MQYPHITFEEVDELSDTSRGEGGFGSTGNKYQLIARNIIYICYTKYSYNF